MKKNVLLLFYPTSWPVGQRGRIPYALLYLERVVRDLALEIILIDEQVTPDYLPVVEKFKDRLFLVGVSAMTGDQIVGGAKFSRLIRERTSAKIVWGGWHPTLLPEQTLMEPYVDFIVLGQGEAPFRSLVTTLLDGGGAVGIPGTGYLIDDVCHIHPTADFVDFTNFPEIDLEQVNCRNYLFKSAYAERCIGYFCSHGCPYNCAFCCVANVYGRRWYKRGVDQIIEHLKYFKTVAGVDSVTFDDDNFFVNRNFTLEFCKRMIDEKIDLLWDTSAHASTFLKNFSDADVELMYAAGCRQIYVGAESGDQEILDMISKGATVEDNLEFVRTLKRHKIIPMLSTMICFPTASGKDVEMTIDMVRRAHLIDSSLRARMFFYTPYPGTELYEKALVEGFVPPTNLDDWPSHTLRKFRAPWAKKDYRLQVEIFANFYFPMSNPGYFRSVPIRKLKPVVFLLNMFFFPIAYLRMRLNFFSFPLEAKCFLACMRFYNKLWGTSYSLGYESYLD